jgi:nickel superoxide dismutase
MRLARLAIILLFLSLSMTAMVYAHCQVPCGIYDDQTRFVLLRECITTIEKSMSEINELSKDPAANINQLVRWVNNKDEQADQFTQIITYYFLTQRIKIVDESDKEEYISYQKKVTLLHQLTVYAMKCKQTTDLQNVEKLKTLLTGFENIYFTPEDQKHLQEHKKQ